MGMQAIINCVLIFIGAVIMLVSIVQAGGLMKTLPFIPERHRKRIKTYLLFHRGLMVFFLIGYIGVIAAFVFRYSLLSEVFVSTIFLLGALFVFIGVAVQSRLLAEVQQTIQGILPICSKCNKVRIGNDSSEAPEEWKEIETYISEKIDVGFSHGYCPECLNEELAGIDRTDDH